MSYMMESYNQDVRLTHNSIRVEELHFHLGDILPQNVNYTEDDNVTLKIVLHYSDPYGRDKRKTITLPSTTIL